MGIGNSPLPIVGTFETTLRFRSGFVRNITFHVIDANIPPLLGLNFLNHESITGYFVSKNYIILNRTISKKIFSNKIFFENPRVLFNMVPSINQNVSCEKTPILPSKVQQAKQLLKVSINEKSSLENAEKIAELLLSFEDVC